MVAPTVERFLGFALVALGVILFLVFGVLKGSVDDVGVYSITAVPIVLGVGFIWRASSPSSEAP